MVVMTLLVASHVVSEDTKSQKPTAAPAIPDMGAAIAKWERAMKPGPAHQKLDYFVGRWNTTTRIWMAGPSAPPTETKGTSNMKWTMDGRFVHEDHAGEIAMPGADGKMQTLKFTGMGLMGHDNFKNLYTANWVDSTRTDIQTMMGASDPTGKVFTYYGPMDEPMLDVYGRTVKFVKRILDDKRFVFEIFDVHAGEGYKVVEIAYERA